MPSNKIGSTEYVIGTTLFVVRRTAERDVFPGDAVANLRHARRTPRGQNSTGIPDCAGAVLDRLHRKLD